jgi:lipid-A-disaccharide synthase-like uncharacterized protein
MSLLAAGMILAGALIWRGAGAPVEPARAVVPADRVINLGTAGDYIILSELVVAPQALDVTELKAPEMNIELKSSDGVSLPVRDAGLGAWFYKILTKQQGHTCGVISVTEPGDYHLQADLPVKAGQRPDRLVVLAFSPMTSPGRFLWLLLGFGGQICFSLRFIIQWLASEKAGRSTVPRAFWYYSLFGGLAILGYAIYTRDPVFIMAYAFNAFIYVRNLVLIRREDRAAPAMASAAASPAGPSGDGEG